jgi:hypothetical protein
MSFEKWSFTFEGAFESPEPLPEVAGVYGVWSKNGEDEWDVLDVGQAENVRQRLIVHDRRDCWKRLCIGTLYYSAYPMPESNETARGRVEAFIREQADPPCAGF